MSSISVAVMLMELGIEPNVQMTARDRGGSDALAGVHLSTLDREHPAWGEVEGVVASEIAPGSRAARAGLEVGDVITAVNRQSVETIRDVNRALEEAPGAVALKIWRDGRTMLIVLRS